MKTLHVASGIKAALLAVGVTASAAGGVIPAPVPVPPPHTQAAPATRKAILIQIDHRLGVIEHVQQTMLQGYETGGIYR